MKVGIGQEVNTLVELFDWAAGRWPDAVAVRDETRELTYAELGAASVRLAAALADRGVSRGSRVGLLLDRTVDVAVSIIAVLRTGGAYVPLDPAYPPQRLAFMLADAGLKTMIAEVENVEGLDLSGVELVSPAAVGAALTWLAPDGDDPAYLIYTSGSTGMPKGCLVSHENVVELVRHTLPLFEFGPGDVWSLFHSYNFDFSVWEMWGALATGGTVVMVPRSVAQSPEEFLAFLQRQRVTVLNQVPSVFRVLASVYSGQCELALRYVIFGGESVDLDVVQGFGAVVRGCRPVMVNMYGITEITVHATFKVLTEADLAGPVRSPIGEPLPHLRIGLFDVDGQPVADGEPGEIWVSGTGVALGYLDRPELTGERFVLRDGVRHYRAGDLARRLPSGELEYLGRNDQQIKLRGFRIELPEIEAALRAHAEVRDAGVTVVVNKHGNEFLVAAYVADGDLDLASLREHLRGTLPGYMVPDRFISVVELPLTPSGKLDRTALRAACEAAIANRSKKDSR